MADPAKGKVKVTTFHDVPENSTDELKAALNMGPVSVAIEADSFSFQYYRGGIFNPKNCGIKLDHGVTAVGYGKEGDQEYYIVRNSWGASWGEKGYIRFAIIPAKEGMCGIQMSASWPETD